MKKRKNQKILLTGFATIVLFVLLTVLVKFVNVQAIGPKKSSVGFATLNGFVHNLTGANMTLYNITDWLGLVPIAFIFGFGLLGLIQLIKRKSLLKVDSNILILGVFYIVVMSAYIFFEFFVINHRPVLIQGILEVSYPSSTTLLVLCVMPTAAMQLNDRVKNIKLRKALVCLIILFTVFMVVGRLISGVHWVTDIIGGAILSAGLVMLYYGTVNIFAKQ